MLESLRPYRQLLARTGVLGASAVLAALLTLVKTKVISVWGGPEDLAYFGLFSGMVAFGAAASSFGITSSAVQKIAPHRDDRAVASHIFGNAMVLSGFGALLVTIALLITFALGFAGTFGLPVDAVGLCVLIGGIACAVVGDLVMIWMRANQQVVLLAFHAAGAALLSAGITAAIYLATSAWRPHIAAISLFAGNAVFGLLLLRRAEIPIREGLGQGSTYSRGLVKFGLAVYGSRLVDTARLFLTPFIVTVLASAQVAGYVQAGSRLSLAIVGLVLSVASKEFYPRLAAMRDDKEEMNLAINRQIVFLTLTYLPAALVVAALPGLFIDLLYSSEFEAAVPVLQAYALGDLARILGWVLGFSCLAAGESSRFALIEVVGHLVFLASLWLATPHFGALGAGVAYLMSGVVHGSILSIWAYRRIGFRFRVPAILSGVAYIAAVGIAIAVNARLGT